MDKLQFSLKLRKATKPEQLIEMLNSDSYNASEKEKIQEKLDKMGVTAPVQAEEKPKKAVPAKKAAPAKKAVPAKKKPVAAEQPEEQPKVKKTDLTEEESQRLKEAEAKFAERQKNRKTPSKSDSNMKAAENATRATKRENLEASTEVPGIALNQPAKLKETGEEGIVVRIYVSDGKEKCMFRIGEGKAIKKRVTALEPVQPAKKVAKKK